MASFEEPLSLQNTKYTLLFTSDVHMIAADVHVFIAGVQVFKKKIKNQKKSNDTKKTMTLLSASGLNRQLGDPHRSL